MSRRTLAILAGVLLSLTGCAAIPNELPARGVAGDQATPQKTTPVAEPERDLSPPDLIRSFMQVSGNPEDDFAAAKPYLTKAAQDRWQPSSSVTVVQDVYSTALESDLPSEPANGNQASVLLTTQLLGRLGGDRSFVPEAGSSGISIQLEKQQDGQWRISKPPPGTFVTLSSFNDVYRQVEVYFLDPLKRVLVPDLRYVAAQPGTGVPARIIDLLLSGPSDGLQDAVASALGPNTALLTGVQSTSDGALLVNLTKPGDISAANAKLIVAQIVRSLQTFTNARIRIQVDGSSLTPDHPDWRPSDLPAYDVGTSPGPDLPGMVVLDGRVKQLDGKQVSGPAGNGLYPVVTAGQSIDGTELALVTKPGPSSEQLRVGQLNLPADVVDLTAATLTRPTWLSSDSDTDVSNEVWTVADGTRVVRAVKSADGSWVAKTVNAADLSQFGPITAMRLSGDGVRVAMVAGGQLIVGAVVRTRGSDAVAIRSPRLLQPNNLSQAVDVDWIGPDELVAATSTQVDPVTQVSVDGGPIGNNRYNPANLTPPVTAVTASPSRPVIAVDGDGMWTTSDVGSVWRPHAVNVGRNSGAVPFYPG